MKLRGLDIDDLLVLVMLLDGKTVTETAKMLHLTQPAVSLRLAKIRTLTGVCVAIKVGKKMIMTSSGKVLAIGAREALFTLLRSLPDAFTYRGGDILVHYILSKRGDWAADECHDA